MNKDDKAASSRKPTNGPASIVGGQRRISPRRAKIGMQFTNLSTLQYRALLVPKVIEGYDAPQPGVFNKPNPSYERSPVLPRRGGLRWHLAYAQRHLRYRIDVGETYYEINMGRR